MTTNSKKLNDKDLRRIFWRSCQLDASWNYERQQNLGYSFGMNAAVDKLHDDPEKKKKALKRGLEFMAVTPSLSTLIMGINAAMEEENAANPNFDGDSINAVKTSLMGPLAGIGDSLIPGTWRIIVTGIAIGFSMAGNVLGPLLFLLLYNIPVFFIRWMGLKKGYAFGTDFISKAEKSGVMEKISTGAAIVGLMAVGGMVANYIWLDIPLKVGSGDFAKPLMGYFDEIMPNMVPLALFGIMYYLLGKKIKTTGILISVVLICVALTFIASRF